MFLRGCLFILYAFSMETMASTLKVEYGFNIYSFDHHENVLTYSKKNYRSVIESKECSKNLFQHFTKKLSDLTSSLPDKHTETIKKDGTEFPVKYHFENKKGELRHDSLLGKKLLSLPQDFDNSRLAIEYRCEGSSK